jgi:hypothetical protein
MRKVEQLPFESCLTWCGGGKGREDYSDGDSDRMVVEESDHPQTRVNSKSTQLER